MRFVVSLGQMEGTDMKETDIMRTGKKLLKKEKNISYTHVISVYLLVCIIALLISIPVFDNMINEHDLEISQDICGLIAEKMNSSIGYITESVTGRAEIVSSTEIGNWRQLQRRLERELNVEGCNSIGLITAQGRVFGKVNEDDEFRKWSLIGQAKNVNKVFYSSPYRQGESGKMVITIFAPIYQDGKRAGELYMTYDLEEFQKMANSGILLQDKMEIYLMNPFSNNYIRCFGGDRATIGSWNNTKLLYNQIKPVKGYSYEKWEAAMRLGESGKVMFFRMNDRLYTQVFVNIDVMDDWSVVVQVPNDALSKNLRVFHRAVIFAIVVLIISLVAIFFISSRSAVEEKRKLEYLSVHDPLTGLANRRAFEDIYEKYLEDNRILSKKGALIFFDVDYFKQINDGYGHAMGDRALKEFAAIAQEIFGENGVVSRFGGDEFIVLMKQIKNQFEVENLLLDFKTRLRELDFLKDESGKVFTIHYSAGIVEIGKEENSLDQIEKKADNALYIVKQRGRDGFEWYGGKIE